MGKRRYRVLVADDEYWICENLRHIVSWSDYGLEFLEPAYDGEAALSRLDQDQVDILITDINMPFLNGLELLKQIHEKHPEVISMVISGYDDFQKVKGAFMEGSINYLLKPVSKSDLVNSISKAIELIGENDANRMQEEKQRLEAQKASSFLQDNEFSSMLLNGEISAAPNICMNCEMDIGGVNLILLKFHNMNSLSANYQHDMLWLSYSVKKQIKDAIGLDKLFVFNYSYHVNEFIICGEMDRSQQEIAIQKLLGLFEESEVGPITIVLGERMYMMENLKEAYHDAIGLMMTRPFVPHSIVLKENHMREELQVFVSKESEKELSLLISKADRAGMERFLFEKLGIAHSQEQEWSLIKMRQIVGKIMNQIINESGAQLSVKDSLNCGILTDMADYEVNQLNLPAVLDLLRELLDYTVKQQREVVSDTIRDTIHKAIAYVDKNYCENISLSELADKFHVEPSYFSKLFHQECGDNLIQYVAKKKIEQAVSLMSKSELNLTEISFMVGYEDYGYFNRVFRKYKGCSPKDYRQELSCRKDA